jgi:transposase
VQGHSDPNRELLDAAALCRQLVPDGSVEAFLADHRHDLFPDEMFEDLFPSRRGRPSVPADVVASVMVLQALEGLSDRDAARALRDRISWKVACGLALTDEGFDYSVLTYWRTRLRTSEHPERIFDAVRAVVDATGVLKGKTRRTLDSTLLDDAVATQDTVTQLISAIRRVRRVVPGALEVPLDAHDYDASGKPLIAWDDPVAKAELVDALVSDALRLLGALEEKTSDEEAAGALGLLALVAGQDVEQDDDGTWRIAQRVAPDRVISTVDPRPATCTSHALNTVTATRPTSPSSPRPGSSPRPSSPRPTSRTPRPHSIWWPSSPTDSKSWATQPMDQARPGLTCEPMGIAS